MSTRKRVLVWGEGKTMRRLVKRCDVGFTRKVLRLDK